MTIYRTHRERVTALSHTCLPFFITVAGTLGLLMLALSAVTASSGTLYGWATLSLAVSAFSVVTYGALYLRHLFRALRVR